MRLLLVDDHPLVAQGLQAVIQHDTEFEIAGYATNGAVALRMSKELDPDMVLVDLRLPGESGLDIIKALRRDNTKAKCVVLTSSSSVHEVREALDMGVDGYVLKEALPEELLAALRRVSQGRKHFDPKAMEVMVQSETTDAALVKELTDREVEVLRELAAGRSNKLIADRLFITENTVKKHISSILIKLQLADRTQAALFAVQNGLGPANGGF